MPVMSQEKRVIEDISEDELSCNDKQPVQPNKVKKTAKKRGRINVNACYRCRRDKKKCDGNYSTKESCRYCRHHKVECAYPEPGRKRVKIVQPDIEDIKLKTTKRIKKVDTRKNPMKVIHERMIKVEENLFDVAELLSNVHQPDIKEFTRQIFFRLLFDESTNIEQTILLRRLWSLIEKIMKYPTCNDEYLYAIYKKLELLESDQEQVRSHMWKEIQSFVDRYNETGDICENESSSIHSLTPPNFNTEITTSLYVAPSLHVSKSQTPQPQSFTSIPPEFDNNNNHHYFEEISLCHSTLNVPTTVQVINDPLITQTKPSPIVPSQRSPSIRAKFLKDDNDNRNIKQNYQESGTSLSAWQRNDDPFTFNNCHFPSPNLIPYIDSSRTFSTNSSHSSTPIVDKLNNETEYFQPLSNEGTNFLNFQSTMSSPLFPNTPTFNSLQPSPSLHPFNEVEHSYGMLSPTNSMIDYIHQIDDEIVLGAIEEQYPIFLPTSSL